MKELLLKLRTYSWSRGALQKPSLFPLLFISLTNKVKYVPPKCQDGDAWQPLTFPNQQSESPAHGFGGTNLSHVDSTVFSSCESMHGTENSPQTLVSGRWPPQLKTKSSLSISPSFRHLSDGSRGQRQCAGLGHPCIK